MALKPQNPKTTRFNHHFHVVTFKVISLGEKKHQLPSLWPFSQLQKHNQKRAPKPPFSSPWPQSSFSPFFTPKCSDLKPTPSQFLAGFPVTSHCAFCLPCFMSPNSCTYPPSQKPPRATFCLLARPCRRSTHPKNPSRHPVTSLSQPCHKTCTSSHDNHISGRRLTLGCNAGFQVHY